MATSVDRSASGYGAYKYQWARHVLRKSLQTEVNVVKHELDKMNNGQEMTGLASDVVASLPTNASESKLRDIAREANQYTFGLPPKVPGQFKMGIVGSGVSGMFTALLIDELNKRFPEFKIDYDILEAGGKKRLGGRLYTHRFEPEPEKHQYYDVGAMRFPKNEVMSRTFKLFDLLDIKEGGEKCPRLIPYYMYDDEKVCPTYFNDVRKFGSVDFKKDKDDTDPEHLDPFGVTKWTPKGDPDRINDDVLGIDPNTVVATAIANIKDQLKQVLDEAAPKNDPQVAGEADKGWDSLMEADFLTTREFFRRKGVIDGPDGTEKNTIVGCGYNFNTIEWLETYAYATGWYNQSLAETVLESLDFDPPDGVKPSNDYWYCIEGGTQLLAERLATKLSKQPEFNKQVTAIETDLGTGEIALSTRTTRPDESNVGHSFDSVEAKEKYFTVFNSTTLGALQKMDLSKANLLYGTKQAIRSLNYGATCKVAIQFEEMWWLKDPWNITKGGLGKTDLPLRVCVYPSYNTKDSGRGVLLCSYSWAQDAQRIGTLIDPKSPANEDELKELMLSNLAQLHADKTKDWPYDKLLKHLRKLYITHHAFDWYHDSNMSGGFGYFGPGQFSKMWPSIIKPNGWLFLIGEAASAHHGWIVGALESSVRAVYQLMHMLNDQAEKNKIKFDGYTKAMDFLRGPEDLNDPAWKSPFVGLPREMPTRQYDTKKGSVVQETPAEKDKDLSFVAAQIITSFYQMVMEVAREEEEKKSRGIAIEGAA